MTADRARRGRGMFLLCLLTLAVACAAQLSWSFSQGPNNRNVSVDTQVNVTGSAPSILNVILQNPITLNANSVMVVTCNLTIQDFNGFGDINATRAEFFNRSSSYGAADDNNTHYTNDSCTPTSQSGAYANYTCSFAVKYYAVNGTWNCTAFVNDTLGLYDNRSNLTNISPLLALNVTTLIDYGQLNMGDTSGNQTANVTNVGNVPINVSVAGYGRNWGDGLGFVCEQGNLTVGLQRFDANGTANYAEKQALTAARQRIAGLTIPKGVNDTSVVNTTYWQLYVDPLQNVFGICNGTIVFQAETA